MAVPKRKKSRSRRDHRRAHHALKEPTRSVCPQCNEIKLPHRVCTHCGYYKGREILSMDETS